MHREPTDQRQINWGELERVWGCISILSVYAEQTGQPGSAIEAGTYYVWTEVSTAMSGQIEECNDLPGFMPNWLL